MCVMGYSKVKSFRYKALELMAIVEEKCPITQRDGQDTVRRLAIKA